MTATSATTTTTSTRGVGDAQQRELVGLEGERTAKVLWPPVQGYCLVAWICVTARGDTALVSAT